jgi:hypothetical protein
MAEQVRVTSKGLQRPMGKSVKVWDPRSNTIDLAALTPLTRPKERA